MIISAKVKSTALKAVMKGLVVDGDQAVISARDALLLKELCAVGCISREELASAVDKGILRYAANMLSPRYRQAGLIDVTDIHWARAIAYHICWIDAGQRTLISREKKVSAQQEIVWSRLSLPQGMTRQQFVSKAAGLKNGIVRQFMEGHSHVAAEEMADPALKAA